MSNNYSKRLSTEQITQKLEQLHYHFDEQYWNDFQQSHQTVSRISPAAIQAKFNPKFLAIPVGLVVIASIVYFSINNMRSQNVTKDTVMASENKLKKEDTPKITQAVNETKQAEKKVVIETPVVAQPKDEQKVEKIEPSKTEVIREDVKQAEPALAVAAEKEATAKKEVAETRKTKKKKKKKRSSDATNNAFVPTAGEDDVVIP